MYIYTYVQIHEMMLNTKTNCIYICFMLAAEFLQEAFFFGNNRSHKSIVRFVGAVPGDVGDLPGNEDDVACFSRFLECSAHSMHAR